MTAPDDPRLPRWHESPDDGGVARCHACRRVLQVGDRFVVCRMRSGGWGALCATAPGADCFSLLGDPAGAVGFIRVAAATVAATPPSASPEPPEPRTPPESPNASSPESTDPSPPDGSDAP